jgi:dolichyl-phosphate beta-glucosyltransferase
MRQVCLIVPCYNEERRLRRDTFLEFLRTRPHASLCLVDDGSSDGTLNTLEALSVEGGGRILVQKLTKNSGKAEAVRQGVLYAASLERFSFLGYWDADLSTPLSQVDLLLAALEADPKRMFALGSRVKRLGSDIDRRAMRHYLGRVFSTMASQLFDLPVYDSQCGAKLFRSEVARPLFSDPFVTKWLFDVELLVRLRRRLGQKEFLNASIEVPLTAWKEMGGSKLRLSHMLRVPIDLLRIRSRG